MSIEKNKIEEILKKLWKEDDGFVSIERISYNKALQDIQYEIDKLEINGNSASISSKSNQPSKKMPIWKHWKDGIAGNGEGKPIYLTKVGNTYSLTSCLGLECDYIELSELDKLLSEKQDEQNHNGKKWIYEDVYLKEREQLYQDDINEVLENPQKYGLEKSADKGNKVEPKFKVGDWVIINNDKIDLDLISFDYLDLNSPLLITDFGIDGQHYKVEDVNGKSDYPRMEFIENRYHLWTLEDAKDGDVLTHSKPTSDDFDYIFIYNKTSLLQAYGYYSKKEDRAFVEDRSHYCPWNMDEVIMPATKKQRDFLRSKLRVIHFKWDSKNKIFFHPL